VASHGAAFILNGPTKSQFVDNNIKFGLPKKFFNFAMFLKK
jgi:hypothetical protein